MNGLCGRRGSEEYRSDRLSNTGMDGEEEEDGSMMKDQWRKRKGPLLTGCFVGEVELRVACRSTRRVKKPSNIRKQCAFVFFTRVLVSTLYWSTECGHLYKQKYIPPRLPFPALSLYREALYKPAAGVTRCRTAVLVVSRSWYNNETGRSVSVCEF